MERNIVIWFCSHFLICVSSTFGPHERYFIPTQEHFIAQQHSLLHKQGPVVFPSQSVGWSSLPGGGGGGQIINPGTVGWSNFPGGGGGGQTINAGTVSQSQANAASGVSFGFPQTNPGGGGLQVGWSSNLPPQFFGGAFGLGFGFGGGWYNSYPNINPYPGIPGNIQNQQRPPQQPQQQQQLLFQNVASASSASSSGFQFDKPTNDLQLTFPGIPTVLKPSQTGWDTSYNIPCGTYQIKPFVVANLRLGTSTSPLNNSNGRRKRQSPFNFPFGDGGGGGQNEEGFSSQHYSQNERSFPTFFPPQNQFLNPVGPPPTQPKTCSWNFNSDGSCKLKFKCLWFQLPALVSCKENYMIVTDTTPNLNNTFCGNRKPRKVYSSSTGRLILTFQSQTSSLPAVFDCAVTCSPESTLNGYKPQSKLILAPLTKDDNFTTSTEYDSTSSSSISTTGKNDNKDAAGVTEKTRIRIGDCKCGVQDDHYLSKGRIVGGLPAISNEFGWTVALVRKSSSRSTRPFCGGTLISDRYILTAAHCVSNNKIIREPRSVFGGGLRSPKELFDILLIEHDVNRLDDVPGGSIRSSVDRIVVHPSYNNVSFDYDVALVRLDRPIEFTTKHDFYRYDTFDFHSRRRFIPEVEARPLLPRPAPICLPSDKGESLVDKYATITGWGLQHEGGNPSDELLKATVQIFNDSLCKEVYKEYNYPVTNSMMCAGYMAGKVDACVGDSGGGLVVKENDKHILAGITSWGRGCGRIKQPGVYTKVSELIDWIKAEAMDGIWCV